MSFGYVQITIHAQIYFQGGGLIMTFYPDDFVIPHNIRVFFQFKGCKKQHITEAAISHELNCFQATIPGKYFF